MIVAIEIAVLVLVEMHAKVNALIKNKMFLVCFIGGLLAIVGLNLYSTIEVEKELFDEIDKKQWKEICDNGDPEFSYFYCY
jgi:predicted tellurium resistance membrane protein TerC